MVTTITAGAPTTARTNYMTNPRVSGITGFSASGTTVTSVTISDLTGYPTALQFDADAANDRAYWQSSTSPNATRYGALFVKAPASAAFRVKFLNTSGANVAGDTDKYLTGTGAWQEISGVSAPFPSTGGQRLELRHLSGTLGTYQATGWTVTDGPGGPFTGATATDDYTTYAWSGTADASTSLEQVPAYVITPALVTGFTLARESGNIVHDISGADYPEVTYRPAKSRRGTLDLFFLTEADAAECITAHTTEEVFTLWDDTLTSLPMRYAVAGRVTPELHFDTGRWLVKVDYVEVAPA